MRRAKVDANQPAIVAMLRQVGASVQHLHKVGQGCPDILVGWRNKNYLLEIKDGDKPHSARELTKAQHVWHATWQGHSVIVKNIDEALKAINVGKL